MRLDDRVTIATPEGVTLELVLAGLGSRFLARLLDSVIQGAIIIALTVGLAAFNAGTNVGGGVLVAIVTILIFLVIFVYDVAMELLNGGRTVGKVAAGIHVVGNGGEPVSFMASAIRNILRIVDFLPVFYLVGATSIVATGRDQRLGDLAGGTVVVRHRFAGMAAMPPPLSVPVEAVSGWDVSAIDTEDVATIRHFLDRRLVLPWHVRAHFANQLLTRVGPIVAGLPSNAHPEYVLEGIVVAKQARA